MIEINLIPENLRRKKRRPRLSGGGEIRIPRETMIGLMGGVLVLLVAAHVLLQVAVMFKFFQMKHYQKRWDQISSSQTNVTRILSELRRLQGNMKVIDEIRGKDWVPWSKKLNEISNQLPRGVWLDWVGVDGKVLLIKGSAVSKNNTEIISIHTFTENLSRDKIFMKGMKDIETGLIKSRSVNTTPVADFSISAELNKKAK